jgi:hypothetical protein
MEISKIERPILWVSSLVAGVTLVLFWGVLTYRSAIGGDPVCIGTLCYDRFCFRLFLLLQAIFTGFLVLCLANCQSLYQYDEYKRFLCRRNCYLFYWLWSYTNFVLLNLECVVPPPVL